MDADSGFILRASRLAGLGYEKDKSRVALAGQEVIVRQADDLDMTVQARAGFNTCGRSVRRLGALWKMTFFGLFAGGNIKTAAGLDTTRGAH